MAGRRFLFFLAAYLLVLLGLVQHFCPSSLSAAKSGRDVFGLVAGGSSAY